MGCAIYSSRNTSIQMFWHAKLTNKQSLCLLLLPFLSLFDALGLPFPSPASLAFSAGLGALRVHAKTVSATHHIAHPSSLVSIVTVELAQASAHCCSEST